MLRKRLESVQGRAAKAGHEDRHEAEAEMGTVSEQLAIAIRDCPRAPEWTTDDCTPEALAMLMSEHGEAADEGG